MVGLVGCIFWLFWFSFEGLVRYVCFVMLTLLGPAYLSTSKDPGDYLGIGVGVRVPILFGNGLLWDDSPY